MASGAAKAHPSADPALPHVGPAWAPLSWWVSRLFRFHTRSGRCGGRPARWGPWAPHRVLLQSSQCPRPGQVTPLGLGAPVHPASQGPQMRVHWKRPGQALGGLWAGQGTSTGVPRDH